MNDAVADLERFRDNYKEIGPAEVAAFGGSAPPDVELAAPILPSNISADAATNAIESRLYGEVDTRVNRYDIHVIGPAPFHVVIRNIARVEETGRVTRSSNFGAYSSYYFLYWAAARNHTGSDVTVRSQAASRPQPYALRELSDDSDVFAAKIDLIPTRATTDWSAFPAADAGETVTLTTTGGYTAAGYSGLKVKRPSGDAPDIRSGEVVVETVPDFSRTIPRLPVNERDFVTVNHPDGSETLRVETTPSVFSTFSPAHDSASRDSRPELSAQVIDGDSGLKDSDIDIIYTVDDGAVNTLNPDDTGYTDEVSSGFAVRARMTRVDDDTDRTIRWWVKAKDKAGNVAYSDRLPNKDGNPDKCVATTAAAVIAADSKCQPYTITVDDTEPSILRAETGRFWDSSLSTGDSDDKTEYRASKASTTSVLVIFSEHLDAGTVQANDFEVNDATPTSADVFNVTVRDDNFQTYSQSPNDPPTGSDNDDDDPDTYGRLTIVSATLDGADISGDLNPNSDGNIFQYHLDGMAVGEYDLEITVEDEAGNRNAAAHKGTIKIIERKPYKLTLNPGWNLVSLPGQPADTDINEVIPANHPIDAVATYDPMVPGTWLTSLESGDGTFDGTVETIQAGLAYWIRTTSFQALEVDIPKPRRARRPRCCRRSRSLRAGTWFRSWTWTATSSWRRRPRTTTTSAA